MFQLFSVDDHIVEPAGVWSDRVPAAMQDRAPHVVEVDGRQMWEWEGGRELTMGLNAVAGKPREQWGMEPVRFEDMIPGCYDPVARAKDFRSKGCRQRRLPDPARVRRAQVHDLQGQGTRVRVRAGVERLHPRRVVPGRPRGVRPDDHRAVWDPELGGAETELCRPGARRRCAASRTLPDGLPGFHTDYWDPLFALCDEAGAPDLHAHRSAAQPIVTLAGLSQVEIAAANVHAAPSAVNMMVSRIPSGIPTSRWCGPRAVSVGFRGARTGRPADGTVTSTGTASQADTHAIRSRRGTCGPA